MEAGGGCPVGLPFSMGPGAWPQFRWTAPLAHSCTHHSGWPGAPGSGARSAWYPGQTAYFGVDPGPSHLRARPVTEKPALSAPWLKGRGSGPIPRGWGWSNHRCQSWNNPLLECVSEALGTVFCRAKSQDSLPAFQGLGQHIWKGLGPRL